LIHVRAGIRSGSGESRTRLLADIAVHSARIVQLLEGKATMAKKRTKTDFTEMNERVRQAREYIARRTEKMRQQRAKEATQPKPD